jgi:single-stranded-DNA-specific exonuclease
MEVLDIKGKKIGSGTIGFQIGPCINATGRLDTAALSVELLLCTEKERARELALTLSGLNKKRQQMTIKNVEEIIEQIQNSSLINDKVLVVYKKDVHESIAGIVAGKVKERFNTPTIVLTEGKEMPKGSGRSIEEYNMFEELIKCKHLLEKFGGHPMAAGLSLREENIETLRQELNKNCSLKDEDKIPIVRIDKRVPLVSVSYNLIEQLHHLEPFGKGNETPVLAEKNVLVDKIYILGKESNTLKLNLIMGNGGKKIDGICFGKVEEFKELLRDNFGDGFLEVLDNYNYSRDKFLMDILYYPAVNSYNGVDSIQLKLLGFRIS